MALADFLQPMPQQPLPDMMAPIYKSLAENALNAPQQAPVQQPSGVHRFLNSIGDALLVANGAPPIHYQRAQQEQVRAALQGFLAAPDQAIAHLMQVDPATAIDLYKSVHPASELPVGVKEYEYEQRLNPEQRAGFEQMLKLTHPGMMAPITEGQNDSYDPGNVPTVSSANEAISKYPEGTVVQSPDGRKFKVPASNGGQTASPSGGFLDAVTAKTESGNRDLTASGAPVTSPKGAKYAMQVMPGTARDPGFGVAPAQSDSPAEYDRVGHEYLQALHQRYGGNLARMWAAYNMGPAAMDRVLTKHGGDWLSHVPPSVRQYVSANLKSAGAL